MSLLFRFLREKFGMRTALTALFTCIDSRVLGEQRGGVTAEELSDRFEWSASPVLQLAVSPLARLNWAATTLTVKAGRGV